MLAKKAWNSVSEPGEVVGFQQPVEPDAVGHLPRRVLHQVAQQAAVQTLPYLPVGIVQAIKHLAAQILGVGYCQVAGLEQQRLGGDVIDVKGREQLVAADHLT